jgi:tetratricopeptide (TPR) repeat protein
MFIRSLFLLLAIALASSVSAQSGVAKADKLLRLKAFDLAVKGYESVIAVDPENAYAYAQLAEAYRMMNNPLDALKAYEKAFQYDENLDADYQLNYAHTLKKVGLYGQASSWYAQYSEVNGPQADYWIESNEQAKELLQTKSKYDVIAYEGNSKESDIGPTFFNDNVVFASFREDLKRENDKKNESYITRRGNQLYIAAKEKITSARDISFLRPDNKELFNLGPLSYSRDGRMVAFTRNNFTKSSNYVFSDESDMSIYFAFTDPTGDFGEIKPFPYNEVEYSYAFPSLGFSGSALYFASNRPGGHGGFDIYVSYLRDGKWSQPENLGPAINSPGNEITPYFDGEQLYFASDYKQGLGGYDLFTSEAGNGSWTQADNMGKGVNSPSDDYYLVVDQSSGAYYFSSNRLGGRGKDDIYIAYPISEQPQELALQIPPAVDLEELAAQNQPVNTDAVPTNTTGGSPAVVTVSSGETVTFVDNNFSLEGAKLTGIINLTNEVANENVFFIQLASFNRSEGSLSNYGNLSQYGSLYRFFKANAVKIRLGYFHDRSEAESILSEVKRAGYRDAFVTADNLSVSNFELLNDNSGSSYNPNNYNSTTPAESQYKVKLGTYDDPLKFNIDAIQGVGRIEQWTKGEWTIFVIGGFPTIEDAKSAQIKARNRGWTDAELVVDEGGILRRVTTR